MCKGRKILNILLYYFKISKGSRLKHKGQKSGIIRIINIFVKNIDLMNNTVKQLHRENVLLFQMLTYFKV